MQLKQSLQTNKVICRLEMRINTVQFAYAVAHWLNVWKTQIVG